jgi:hypothetical protein
VILTHLVDFFFEGASVPTPPPPPSGFGGASSWGPFFAFDGFSGPGDAPVELTGGSYRPTWAPRRGR